MSPRPMSHSWHMPNSPYGAHNTTREARGQATKTRGQHGDERVLMILRLPAVVHAVPTDLK